MRGRIPWLGACGQAGAGAWFGLYRPARVRVRGPGVGFDDVPFASLTDPPLTTVRQPTEEKGHLAARVLLDALEADGASEPTRTVLPTELVVRGSTGPPP